MATRKQAHGLCVFCGRRMARGGLARHLPTCPARQEAIAKANQGPGEEEALYHLEVRDAWDGQYWLHLEIRGSATLRDLDYYLRAIWLECCGHLSQFHMGGWSGREIPMRTRAERVFQPGVTVMHIYDFGTSSETLIRAVSVRRGKPLSAHPIYLMARNDPPEAECKECGAPATWLCLECVSDESTQPGTLCAEHMEGHRHDDVLVLLVNSPRIGKCGYDGPAEPPY